MLCEPRAGTSGPSTRQRRSSRCSTAAVAWRPLRVCLWTRFRPNGGARRLPAARRVDTESREISMEATQHPYAQAREEGEKLWFLGTPTRVIATAEQTG